MCPAVLTLEILSVVRNLGENYIYFSDIRKIHFDLTASLCGNNLLLDVLKIHLKKKKKKSDPEIAGQPSGMKMSHPQGLILFWNQPDCFSSLRGSGLPVVPSVLTVSFTRVSQLPLGDKGELH